MAIEDEVFSQTLKHKGYFDFSDFYNYCFDWLKDEGFDVAEDEYTEKTSAAGKEILISWKISKKVSDYIKHTGKVSWHITQMVDEEVMIDGKKKKMNKGDVKLKISASIVKDYDSKWDANPRLKMWRGIYDRYIIKSTIGMYAGRLEGKMGSFVGDVKSYLNLSGK